MEWSNDLRNRCFGSNKKFINNYCSPLTLKELGAVSGRRIDRFRDLAKLLTEKFPGAAHFTPGWSRNPNPVIALGNLPIPGESGFNPNSNNNLEIKINAPRIGLCLDNNDRSRLALWAEAFFLESETNSETNPVAFNQINKFDAEWTIWRRSKSNNRSLDKFVCSSDVSNILDNDDFTNVVGGTLNQGGTDKTIITRQQDGGDVCFVETLSPLVIHMRNRAKEWFQPT